MISCEVAQSKKNKRFMEEKYTRGYKVPYLKVKAKLIITDIDNIIENKT